jgi:hypothetical protein
MELSYQEYISQNYVEIINNDSQEDKRLGIPSIWNQANTNILMSQFIMSDSLYKLKKNCIVLVQFPIVGSVGSILSITDKERLKQITDLGFEIYNNKKNHLNIKIRFPDEDIWLCNYNFKKGQQILFKDYEPIRMYYQNIIFIFDNFIYTSELDYNKYQKKQEQEIIYEKEQIINKTIIKLEQELNNKYELLNTFIGINKKEKIKDKEKIEKLENNYKDIYDKYVLLNTLNGINQRDIKEDKLKIKKLEQENEDLKERLKRIEDKIFMPIEHKYF